MLCSARNLNETFCGPTKIDIPRGTSLKSEGMHNRYRWEQKPFGVDEKQHIISASIIATAERTEDGTDWELSK